MYLFQNIVGAITKQMHSFTLPCSLTIAAAGKRTIGCAYRLYDSEVLYFFKQQNILPGLALSTSLLQNTIQFSITAPTSRVGSNSGISLTRGLLTCRAACSKLPAL
jgi:hypothetical protein